MFDTWWSDGCEPFAYAGVALADGQGNTKGPSTAISLAKLGYVTAFFGDSDEPLNPDENELNRAGVCTILWSDRASTEERIALDLPWRGFVEMALFAINEFGIDHVQAKISLEIGCQPKELPEDPKEWKHFSANQSDIRIAFAKAAKKKRAEWFKRVDRAEKLGGLIIRYWDCIEEKPLGLCIAKLKDWVYD